MSKSNAPEIPERTQVSIMVYLNCLSVAMRRSRAKYVQVGVELYIHLIRDEIRDTGEDIRSLARSWNAIKRICKTAPKKATHEELLACRVILDAYQPSTGQPSLEFSVGKTISTYLHNIVKHYLGKYRSQNSTFQEPKMRKKFVFFLKYCLQTMALILWLGGIRFNELFRTFIPTFKQCILLKLPAEEKKDVVVCAWQVLYNVAAQYGDDPSDFYALVIEQDKFFRLEKALDSLKYVFRPGMDYKCPDLGTVRMCQVAIGALLLDRLIPILDSKGKHKLVKKYCRSFQPVLGAAIQRLYVEYVTLGKACGFQSSRERGRKLIFNGGYFSTTATLDHSLQCAYLLAKIFSCEDNDTFDEIVVSSQEHGLELAVNLISYLWECSECELYVKRYRELGILERLFELLEASKELHEKDNGSQPVATMNFIITFSLPYRFLTREEKVRLARKSVQLFESISSGKFTSTNKFYDAVLTLMEWILFADNADLFDMFGDRVRKKCEEIESWGFSCSSNGMLAKKVFEEFVERIHTVKSGGVVKFEFSKYCKSTNLSECKYCRKSTRELMRCSRCRVVYYCSRDCQSKDWKHHKKICKKK